MEFWIAIAFILHSDGGRVGDEDKHRPATRTATWLQPRSSNILFCFSRYDDNAMGNTTEESWEIPADQTI